MNSYGHTRKIILCGGPTREKVNDEQKLRFLADMSPHNYYLCMRSSLAG